MVGWIRSSPAPARRPRSTRSPRRPTRCGSPLPSWGSPTRRSPASRTDLQHPARQCSTTLVGIPRALARTSSCFSTPDPRQSARQAQARSERLTLTVQRHAGAPTIEAIADTGFFEAQLRRLKLDSGDNLREDARGSVRELRAATSRWSTSPASPPCARAAPRPRRPGRAISVSSSRGPSPACGRPAGARARLLHRADRPAVPVADADAADGQADGRRGRVLAERRRGPLGLRRLPRGAGRSGARRGRHPGVLDGGESQCGGQGAPAALPAAPAP